MNLPKFIKDDERLFRLLLGDLFPSLELPVPEYGALQVRYTRAFGADKPPAILCSPSACVVDFPTPNSDLAMVPAIWFTLPALPWSTHA